MGGIDTLMFALFTPDQERAFRAIAQVGNLKREAAIQVYRRFNGDVDKAVEFAQRNRPIQDARAKAAK